MDSKTRSGFVWTCQYIPNYWGEILVISAIGVFGREYTVFKYEKPEPTIAPDVAIGQKSISRRFLRLS